MKGRDDRHGLQTCVIHEYQKKGLIEKVKRDLYAVISLETKQPLFSRYQLASHLFEDAHLSHHSAFEVFGCANQVYNICYVATEKRFSDFEYDGITYHRTEYKPRTEIIRIGDIKTTFPEQTVIDSIRDLDKVAGPEEVLRCLLLIPGLNEQNMLRCLQNADNGFLYQKCGYFKCLNRDFLFSDEFFAECQRRSSEAIRYFSKDFSENTYHKRWKLYAPVSV